MSDRIGNKLKAARLNKQLSLEDAARATKIKAARLEDLENEEFSQFPTLVYARGFLNIYAKYLGVDASEYLDHMAGGHAVSTDGYSYLDAAEPETREVARRKPPSRLPQMIMGAVIVILLVIGVISWLTISWYMQRLAPGDAAIAELPEEAEVIGVDPVATPLGRVDAIPQPPTTPIPAPTPTPAPTPVVLRAIPVNPDDLPAEIEEEEGAEYQIEIRPIREILVQVRLYELENQPIYDALLSPGDQPLVYIGTRFWVTVEDPTAVRIMRNGQELPFPESPLLIE